jgi:EAL domain-containing protein (putative c-di-GMP-specific phosphodiesterase class I)/DNA-binding NarL/FixJ family response regulator
MAAGRVGDAAWRVLLVDDEEEVHALTRLVLGRASFEGRPIALESAYSAAEAMQFLAAHPDTALVLLDVVMETDDSGLALVRDVRERLRNSDIQIVLRTGQPGMAPEREVIRNYEINGYFLKTEITAQKLHSIVISSLRAYQYIKLLRPRGRATGEPVAGAPRSAHQRRKELALIEDLRAADPYLLAQPEVHLASNAIVGIELLPSWKTRQGLLTPAHVVTLLRSPEERRELDRWLLAQACAWAQSWQGLHSPQLRVSVPVLTEHVWDPQFQTMTGEALARAEVPRGTIDLAIPEAKLLDEQPATRDALARLQETGATITLVDFGSGMISLPLLRRLRPDRLKIHPSFVRNAASDPERSAVARSIVALAHTLGLTVVAEGIASDLDLEFFRWEGCDLGQGDALARPVTVGEVPKIVASRVDITH